MAEPTGTSFPGSLDVFVSKTNNVSSVLVSETNTQSSAVKALETKVGSDSSSVATSHDFLITANINSISGNATNITANTSSIAANASDIATLQGQVATLITNTFAPQFEGFYSTTKKDLTTAWADLDNLVSVGVGTGVTLNGDGKTLEFAATGKYRIIAMVAGTNVTGQGVVGIRATVTPDGGGQTEITPSWTRFVNAVANFDAPQTLVCYVDIEDIDDVVLLQATGDDSNADVVSGDGPEADPTTRNNISIAVEKVANT